MSRYRIERTLGRGGMASVYLARDTELDRPVALKVLAGHLAGDDLFRRRFVREARLAARLGHPNVVRIYDVGEDERGPFIVMEYVEGETLADELGRRGRLPAYEVVDIGRQVCAGLAAAHAEGLVHRDVKPQNLLRARDGKITIADFGIARSADGTALTEHGTILGSAAYLAPEQAQGEPVGPATDIYALGVVLYELLTGRLPLATDGGALVPPGELAPVPPQLEATVMRCLALRPEYRPQSAGELAEALGGGEVAPPTPRPRRRRRWSLLAGLGAAGLAAIAVVLADSGGGHPPKAAASTPAATTTATAAVRPPPPPGATPVVTRKPTACGVGGHGHGRKSHGHHAKPNPHCD